MKDLGFVSRQVQEASLKRPDLHWDPYSLLFNGYRGPSPGLKRPWHNFDQLLSLTAAVKNFPPFLYLNPLALEMDH